MDACATKFMGWETCHWRNGFSDIIPSIIIANKKNLKKKKNLRVSSAALVIIERIWCEKWQRSKWIGRFNQRLNT